MKWAQRPCKMHTTDGSACLHSLACKYLPLPPAQTSEGPPILSPSARPCTMICSICRYAPRPPPLFPDPGNDCPSSEATPGKVRPAAELQVSKKPEARPASLPLDERSDSGYAAPPWPEEDLPHDLGHDCSPSPSDAWPDMSDSDTAARPLGETRCAVCGEELPDAAAIDRHIWLHRPSPLQDRARSQRTRVQA